MNKSAAASRPSPLLSLYRRLVRKIVVNLPYLEEDLRGFYGGTSMEYAVRQLQARGFDPKSIVDCGAYMGDWTRMVKRIFPGARVLMFEPQADKRQALADVCTDFPGTVECVSCLLGPQAKEAVTFFEMESGSSVLEELTSYSRKTITLPMRTLDDTLREKNIQDATFLKLDVQGFEIEVLKGAAQAMKRAEVILLEVSFVPFNRSAPLFDEVVKYMRDNGFMAYDICNFHRVDNAPLQGDAFFVKMDSPLRKLSLG
jgi:FkbM family methyltransferase